MFYGHLCAQGRLKGPATSKCKEAESKMKQPSDMPTPRFEHGGIVICGPTRYRYTTEEPTEILRNSFAHSRGNSDSVEVTSIDLQYSRFQSNS